MFCEKCGTKNDSSNKFCEKCGNKLEAEVKTKKSENQTKATKSAKDITTSAKNKFNTLSKKQKLIGGIVLALVVILVVLYFVGAKLTSLDTLGSKAFEELASKGKISDKYLYVSLNSDEYFVSLADKMKETIEDEEIAFDYSDYTVTTSQKKITIKYYDKDADADYKVVFTIRQDGKTLLLYDKYVITKITVENKDENDTVVLYDPKDTEELTLTAVKGSTITIDDKELSDSYINSKKSDDETDVYEIKGVSTGSYDVQFTLGKLVFEKTLYVYSDDNNEYELSNYVSSSYLTDDSKDFTNDFKTYITTYYEYVNDSEKTIDDFNKKYAASDDIKDTFADSKEYAENLETFKIDDVTLRSLYYYSSDEELTVTFKVNYTYKFADSDSEKTSYNIISVTYDLSNTELPKSLSYMPY